MSQDLTLTLESAVDASGRKVGTPAFGPVGAFNPNDVNGWQADAFNGDFFTGCGPHSAIGRVSEWSRPAAVGQTNAG